MARERCEHYDPSSGNNVGGCPDGPEDCPHRSDKELGYYSKKNGFQDGPVCYSKGRKPSLLE